MLEKRVANCVKVSFEKRKDGKEGKDEKRKKKEEKR